MATQGQKENRADAARVLLALTILALIAGLDESRSRPGTIAMLVAAESRQPAAN
jgi:hypothetical protein